MTDATELLKPPAGKPKILVFDIETAPYRPYTWGLYKPNVIDVEREWFMLSFAYGWYDIEKQKLGRIQFVSCEQDPRFEAGSDLDIHVVYTLHELFDQAEIIVGQNHERFDLKKANERFFIYGLLPPSPYATLDTKRIWKRNFSGSASLKYMARKADVALKESAGGFGTWLGCMNNDPKAWAKMKRYNIADVRATAEVFTRLIPWTDSLQSRTVNFGHYKPGEMTCPRCMNTWDEEGFVKRGFHGTGASRFQTLECRKCGAFPRDYTRVSQRKPEDKVVLR
jgi:hypothetical protein